jgi:hypothetical protein
MSEVVRTARSPGRRVVTIRLRVRRLAPGEFCHLGERLTDFIGLTGQHRREPTRQFSN